MNDAQPLREGALLWQPSEAFKAASTMTDYMEWLDRERGLRFADYAELWRWSVDDLAAFWSSVVDYYEIPLRGAWTEAFLLISSLMRRGAAKISGTFPVVRPDDTVGPVVPRKAAGFDAA